MAGITFSGVTKQFGDGTVAVDELDLEIHDGEFMIFVGPSGCGKTTALRMVAGLEDPTSGEILIGGKVVNDLDPVDRDIAMVFQNYALYPHMTVRDNIGFPLRMQKLAKEERRRRIEDAAELLGIARAARAQAGSPLGRPATARRDGSRDRPPSHGVPDGRAALESRREAPRADACGAREAAPASRA